MIEYWKDAIYLLGILIAFISGNKSKKIQLKGSEIDNLLKYQQMYEKFTTHSEKRYDELVEKVEILTNDVCNLNIRNAVIFEESETWKRKFNELQKLYNKLKEEFESYKLKHR